MCVCIYISGYIYIYIYTCVCVCVCMCTSTTNAKYSLGYVLVDFVFVCECVYLFSITSKFIVNKRLKNNPQTDINQFYQEVRC